MLANSNRNVDFDTPTVRPEKLKNLIRCLDIAVEPLILKPSLQGLGSFEIAQMLINSNRIADFESSTATFRTLPNHSDASK